MDVILVGAAILLFWTVLTIINIWCVAAMLWLCFDAAYMKGHEKYTLTKEYKRAKISLIEGGKDDRT